MWFYGGCFDVRVVLNGISDWAIGRSGTLFDEVREWNIMKRELEPVLQVKKRNQEAGVHIESSVALLLKIGIR